MLRGFKTFGELLQWFPTSQLDPNTREENVFVSLTLPNEDDLRSIQEYARCSKCGGSVCVVASDLRPPCAALMTRCRSCYQDHFFFVTQEKSTSSDIAIFTMSPKAGSTKSLFDGFTCPQCSKPFHLEPIDTSSYDLKTIVATHLRCTACSNRQNVVFWDPPRNYFTYCIELGDKARPIIPAAALVFYVAAVENYLQKCFISSSPFCKYLVSSRRIGFQDLQVANNVYQNYFNLSLSDLAGSNWLLLSSAVKKRNMIVHNAGHDQQFNQIEITDAELQTIRDSAVAFVNEKLRPEMRKRMVD